MNKLIFSANFRNELTDYIPYKTYEHKSWDYVFNIIRVDMDSTILSPLFNLDVII